MEERVLIVKYGEIAMRGNNRKLFITRLVNSIRKNLDAIGDFYVVREQGRLIVESRGKEFDFEQVIPKVTCIFGLVGVCPGIKTDSSDLEHLKKLSLSFMDEKIGEKEMTFKVETKRADKRYPLSSHEISAAVGEYLLENRKNLSVDVHKPEIVLWLELRNEVYLYSSMVPAFGGLPVGSSGKGLSLLSGGIDSPVATWMMAKRGVEVEGVYFHSPPYTSEWAKQKVRDLSERISVFTGGFKLHIVPFTKLQLYLLEKVPEDKLTIFLKRAMMRTAEKIAEKENAQVLITGDSVGQVASQTIQAIHAINAVCHMPVLRPLAGMDKQEIVNLASKIGTFEISIRPFEDCCTIFVAKHPETRPKTSVIDKMEASLLELDTFIEQAVEETIIEIW